MVLDIKFMKKIVLFVSIAIVLTACENKVSKAEYDFLHEQYIQKCEDIQYLQTECERLEDNIEMLRHTLHSNAYSNSFFEAKISSAINAAKECAEYYKDFEDNCDRYDNDRGKFLIEVVLESVNACQ